MKITVTDAGEGSFVDTYHTFRPVSCGASHLAFIIVPLVAAFFIDLVNALLIPFFLANF